LRFAVSLLINVALLTLGFLGTLAAFGGETWRRGDEPLRRRITRRGWASITFLSLALLLGITKEIRNSRETGGLTSRIANLQEQLAGQRALLAAKRLEEVAAKKANLSDFEHRLSSIRAVFASYRNSSISITGRTARDGSPPPFPMVLAYASDDFLFNVCSKDFARAAERKFEESKCSGSSLLLLVREIPDISLNKASSVQAQ
jgi:hypothetical protein